MSVFFFQAEDGIRDAQESRGLGDVYKRQLPVVVAEIRPDGVLLDFNHPLAGETLHFDIEIVAVSYTHLTLPTIYSV